MHVLLVHCDDRSFEPDRFGAAWERAGGVRDELVPTTPATVARALLEIGGRVHGLLLTGGPDVAPERYGARPQTGVRLHLDLSRDALDMHLLVCADKESWPVLAVCYGCQVLNVFHGGTLIQDLVQVGLHGHYVPQPKDHLAHTVEVSPRARWLTGVGRELRVNSRHHQAIDRLASRLRVVARAEDGVIEAVEPKSAKRYVVGVQWHPENLIEREEHVAIFHAFRSACLERVSRVIQ